MISLDMALMYYFLGFFIFFFGSNTISSEEDYSESIESSIAETTLFIW